MGSLKDVPVVIELVLIGFQVLVWASLLMFAIFGFKWIHLDALKDWNSQLSVGLIGVAYMFGLIFDKAVSALPYSWVVADNGLTSLEDQPSPRAMRMEVLIKNPNAAEALERRINQHRLVRSTVFNLALISLSALIFFLIRLGFSMRLFVSFLVLSALFVSLSLFTGKRSAQMIYFDLHQAFQAVTSASDTGLRKVEESGAKLKEEKSCQSS
jgi:hypothetical protein